MILGLAIGLSIGGFIYVALSKRGFDASQRKSLAIASFGVGFAITWWLSKNTAQIEAIMDQVVVRGVAILMAALVAALFYWRIRKVF